MAPSVPRAPRERLASLKDSRPRPAITAPAWRVQPRTGCPECGKDDIQEIDGQVVCMNCGSMVSDSNIVSEVTFGETSTGAAVVQGTFVGEGQRHAKSTGAGFRNLGGTVDSRANTERNGRNEIRRLAGSLHTSLDDQAFRYYQLALANNFTQGRNVPAVAAVCLYLACRNQAGNTVLLMDLAEKIKMNVYKLGEVYKDLLKTLFIEEPSRSGARLIEVEPLIEKFARKLEFGDSTRQVCTDAVKILARMNRDWMVTGRHPAGLCGACIILAARMNKFRRTVREVVYVVRVADLTIHKRLEEFKRTTSGNLTIDQFRSVGVRLKKQHDPPAMYLAKEREEKKYKRIRRRLEAEADVVIPDDHSESHSRQGSERPAQPRSEPRRDADGFVIPDVPIDPSLLEAANVAGSELRSSGQNSAPVEGDPVREATAPLDGGSSSEGPPRKKRKRKEKPPPPVISEEDLIAEEELEKEIEDVLGDPTAIANMNEVAATAALEARANALAEQLMGQSDVCDSEEIGTDEFDDDPEVKYCLLSPEEVAAKERIWVTHNEDWLRAQQRKHLEKALEEAAGKKKKERQKRKRDRMGDGSVLEGGTPVASPAEANQRMLQKRGKKGFSKHINYDKLNEIYGRGTITGSTSSTTSPSGDSSQQSRAPTPAPDDVAPLEESPARAASPETRPEIVSILLPTPPATQVAQPTQASQIDQAADGQGPLAVVEEENDEEEEEDEEHEGEEHIEEEAYDEEEDIEGTARIAGIDWDGGLEEEGEEEDID